MEEWRKVEGLPDYEVSNQGRVRSWKPCLRLGRELPRMMCPTRSTSGYLQVVFMHEGKQFTRHVHVLVLETFVGPRPDGFQACHFNGERLDNRVENLRWDTPLGNHADRRRHGTIPHKLSGKEVLEILALKGSVSAESVARSRGLHGASVRAIWSGRAHRHLTRPDASS